MAITDHNPEEVTTTTTAAVPGASPRLAKPRVTDLLPPPTGHGPKFAIGVTLDHGPRSRTRAKMFDVRRPALSPRLGRRAPHDRRVKPLDGRRPARSLLLLVALAACSARTNGTSPATTSTTARASTTTTTTPGVTVPVPYEDLYSDLQAAVADASADPRLAIDAGIDTTWGIELLAANGNRGEALLRPQALAAVRTNLDHYVELGVTGVTVAAKYPLLATWFPGNAEYARFYEQVAAEVRARGLRLFVDVSPLFSGTVFSDVVVEPARLTLDQLTADLHGITQRAINLMHPDWLVIIDEPDTVATLTGIPEVAEIESFVTLVNTVVDGIDRGDTDLVGGAGTWMPRRYLEALAARLDVQVLGLHIYPVSDTVIDTTVAASDAAHRNGKHVLLDETWLYKAHGWEAGGPATADSIFRRDSFSFWEQLDIEFIALIGDVARSQGMVYVAPFWAGLFFSYIDWTPALDAAPYRELTAALNRLQAAALVGGQHTGVGDAYASLAGG